MEDDVAQVAGDSESISTELDVEGDNVARDVNGKPMDVVGQSSFDTKLASLQSCLSVSTLQQLYTYMHIIIFMFLCTNFVTTF